MFKGYVTRYVRSLKVLNLAACNRFLIYHAVVAAPAGIYAYIRGRYQDEVAGGKEGRCDERRRAESRGRECAAISRVSLSYMSDYCTYRPRIWHRFSHDACGTSSPSQPDPSATSYAHPHLILSAGGASVTHYYLPARQPFAFRRSTVGS